MLDRSAISRYITNIEHQPSTPWSSERRSDRYSLPGSVHLKPQIMRQRPNRELRPGNLSALLYYIKLHLMNSISEKENTAKEAKALVALAFRIGPIETIHSAKYRPIPDGQSGQQQRITDLEMKGIMKYAVDQLYRLLRMKIEDPLMYEAAIRQGAEFTTAWDEPIGAPAAKTVPQHDSGILHTAVLVYIPLTRTSNEHIDPPGPYSEERRRNRLEWILSQVGTAIKVSGLAIAHECSGDSYSVKLLLAGTDAKAIQAEMSSFLEFMKLPEGSRMLVLPGGDSPPEEILLS